MQCIIGVGCARSFDGVEDVVVLWINDACEFSSDRLWSHLNRSVVLNPRLRDVWVNVMALIHLVDCRDLLPRD